MPSASMTPAGFIPPPLGINYATALDPSIKFLVIGTACSATLVPLLVVLFFFSNSSIRRQPVFILNVLMIALGLCEGAINIYNQTRAMFAKPVPVGFAVAFACLEVLVPMVADLVLLVRVTIVYPPCDMHCTYVVGIYVPMAMIKTARLIVEIMFIVQWSQKIMHHANDNLLVAGQEAWNTPFPRAAWVIQLVDSTYASTLFLLRLKQRHRPTLSIPGSSNDTNCSGSTKYDHDPLTTLFWISASNFVFPVILDLTLLVIAFRDPSFLNGVYVLMVSNYVDIVSVLLATIWSTRNKYPHAQPRIAASPPMDGLRTAHGRNLPGATIEESANEGDAVSIPMTVVNANTTCTPSDAQV